MTSPAQSARAAADRFIAQGMITDQGDVGDPLPIRSPEGSPAGWFIPILAGEQLRGFIQLDEALTFLRHSRFPQTTLAASWTDPDHVRRVAEKHFPDAAPEGTPFLTYDAHPTRLAWAVPTRDGMIFVSGDFAYRA